jgi:hypothetical protein
MIIGFRYSAVGWDSEAYPDILISREGAKIVGWISEAPSTNNKPPPPSAAPPLERGLAKRARIYAKMYSSESKAR